MDIYLTSNHTVGHIINLFVFRCNEGGISIYLNLSLLMDINGPMLDMLALETPTRTQCVLHYLLHPSFSTSSKILKPAPPRQMISVGRPSP